MSAWSAAIFGMRSSSGAGAPIAWEKAALVFILGVTLSFYHFSRLFTGRNVNRLPLVGAYIAASITALLAVLGFVVPEMKREWYGYAPVLGPMYLPFLAVAYGLTLLAVRNLLAHYRHARDPSARNRTAYVLLGAGCALGGGIVDSFPALMGLYPFGMLGNLLFAGFTAVAIVKHNLLDVRVVIARGLVYSAVSTIVLGVYLSLLLSLSLLFGRNVATLSWPANLAAVLAAAILLKPALDRVQRLVDRRFWRRRADHVRALEDLSEQTREVTDLTRLATALEQAAGRATGAQFVRLIVPTANRARFSSITRGAGHRQLSLSVESCVVRRLRSTAGTPKGYATWTELEAECTFPSDHAAVKASEAELLVPLSRSNDLIGVLVLAGKRSGQPYSEEDISLLRAAVNQTAMGLVNARLFAELATQRTRLRKLLAQTITVQEDERRRLSIELHDSPLQMIASALYRLEACLDSIRHGESAAATAELKRVRGLLDGTLEELRRTTGALHPPELEKVGLVKALARYIRAYERSAGPTCDFRTVDPVPRLPDHVELTVYRIVQEALSNIHKHSRATRVEVRLGVEEGALNLVVSDDGVGFDPECLLESEYPHLGLAGMEERVRMLGGSLDINSTAGRGTEISLVIPEQQDAVDAVRRDGQRDAVLAQTGDGV